MKFWTIRILSVAVLGAFVACASSPKPETAPAAQAADTTSVAPKKDSLVTSKDRYSYALGMDMGRAIKNINADIDKDIFLRSLGDQMDGKPLMMTDSQAEKALQELVLAMQMEQQKKEEQAARKALEDQKAFLEKNKTVEGVFTTPSGLQYKYLAKSSDSTAKTPKLTDKVRVHYAGSLLDGTEFDSSIQRGEPLEFPVNAVIRGWQELLLLMKEGDKVEAWIPSELGYGAAGASPVIPPNSMLVFKVELLNVIAPIVVDTAKAPEAPKVDSAAQKPAQDSVQAPAQSKADSIAAAKKAKADSLAAVKAAKKAKADSLAAVKKAKADSVAAVKKAKADSLAAAKKAKADSLAAVKAAKKAKADSLAAVKKAKNDSIAAAKKAKADSLAAVKKAKNDSIAAAKKAKADSIAAVNAAKKAERDSIAAAKEAAKKAKADSLAAVKKAKADSVAAAKKAKEEAAAAAEAEKKAKAEETKAAPAAEAAKPAETKPAETAAPAPAAEKKAE